MNNLRHGILLTMFLMLGSASQKLFAQDFVSAKKGSAIGFSGNLVNFNTSLPNSKSDPGYSIMYWKGLANILDLSLRYNGLFSDYSELPGARLSGAYKSEGEASLHLRPAGDNHMLLPFISAGIGVGGMYSRKTVPYAPLGGGLQLNFFSESYILLQVNYRESFQTKYMQNNMFYSLGVLQEICYGKPKLMETPAPPVVMAPPVVKVLDRDNDGVPDSLDACPDEPGPASLQGCPDRDGDGIADKDDKCPDIPGVAKYGGCPIPDTDHDGINDEEDKCPTVPGVARYGGCPVPDRDSDGVNDEEDKCPDLPGPASNHGCPEVKAEVKKRIDIAAKNIYFATGSAKLLATSNKSLNAVAAILTTDANLKIDVNGYTDNKGQPEKNLALSQNRAKAVYDYLAKKGIAESRLKSAGFGDTSPIADNKTAMGRSKNRRVELKLHYD
jgi:OOP family OmpA-OmpF porin